MNMTHYMSLLADNQPWNLLIFMAIPVICAETLTITEFFIIFNRIERGGARTLNKIVGIFDGLYFTGIFIFKTPITFMIGVLSYSNFPSKSSTL